MTENLNNVDNNNNKNFIGKGSYGCTYFPGIDCSGKKNKKKYLTKIEEINYYSHNEIKVSKIVKKIPNFKNYFCPILNHCLVTFEKLEKSSLELDKCDTLFDGFIDIKKKDEFKHLLYDKKINKNFEMNKYYLFSIKFIDNTSLKKFFVKINNHTDFFNNYLIIYLQLLNSIYLLNKHNIIHNDLHYENIIIDNKNDKPIIIDFGLSYNLNKMFNQNNVINLKYLKRFYMDFREDSYNHNLEKRFISYITYNNTPYHNIKLQSNFEKNNLTKQDIDYFIFDTLQSIKINEEMAIFFIDKEIDYYKSALEKFYYKYLHKETYKYYTDIVNELLPFVFKFEDLYKLTIDYLLIYYIKQNLIDTNINFTLILKCFIQIIKKTLHPDPYMRLKISEINLIIKFIIKKINTIDITLNNTQKKNYFYSQLDEFIVKNNLSKNIIFQKEFAYIDFDSILNNDVINFIKNSNIKV